MKHKYYFLTVLVTVGLLVFAIFNTIERWHFDYGYFVLLRFACCISFVWTAFLFKEKPAGVWWSGVFAVLYNPIVKIHLSREIWCCINVFSIIALIVFAIILLKSDHGTPEAR